MWPFNTKKSAVAVSQVVQEQTQEKKTLRNSTNIEVFNQIMRQMVTNRSDLRGYGISGQNDGSDKLHNVYNDFGYPEQLSFDNFWNMYRRFGVAKAVIETPVELSWVHAPEIKSENENFLNLLGELIEKIELWERLKGLDKRQRVGRYGGLYLRTKDGKLPNLPVGSLSGIESIVSITPLYEGQIKVLETDSDPMSENFDMPTMYQYVGSGTGNRNERSSSSFSIHPSRLIVAAEGADDGGIYGIPSLECVFNDLMDLRKITGAGGEGFYQNTRMAPVFTANDDFSSDDSGDESLSEAIDDFLAQHRKRLVLRGIKAEYPNIQLSAPEEFYQATINNIAAGSGIPAAFLIGQQTGRLASDKDSRHLMTLVQSRRESFLSVVIKNTIDWFIDHNVLPMAEYTIDWGDLLTMSDGEKIEVVQTMAAINEKQSRSGGLPVFSVEEMRERVGLNPDVEIELLEVLPDEGDLGEEEDDDPEEEPGDEAEGDQDNDEDPEV